VVYETDRELENGGHRVICDLWPVVVGGRYP
jgi:hypothetical protein